MFPWLSVPQIKRLLKKLEEGELLIKGNYNKNRFDKTVWYTLDEPEFRVEKIDDQKSENSSTTPEITDSTKSYYRESDTVLSSVRNRTISTDNKPDKNQVSKLTTTRARDFSLDEIVVALYKMGMPKTEAWYATRKAHEYMARFPDSRSVADACRYVVNAIDHARTLEGKPG